MIVYNISIKKKIILHFFFELKFVDENKLIDWSLIHNGQDGIFIKKIHHKNVHRMNETIF